MEKFKTERVALKGSRQQQIDFSCMIYDYYSMIITIAGVKEAVTDEIPIIKTKLLKDMYQKGLIIFDETKRKETK